jgi:hypothetical protein
MLKDLRKIVRFNLTPAETNATVNEYPVRSVVMAQRLDFSQHNTTT